MLRTVAIALAAGGCATEPSSPPPELWAADLPATQQVLIMSLAVHENEVSGTGRLSHLTDTGGDMLTIAGTRKADSLFLTYHRASLPPFGLHGAYGRGGLSGVLDGGEFDSLAVLFRRP